jgi:hypothetical protein
MEQVANGKGGDVCTGSRPAATGSRPAARGGADFMPVYEAVAWQTTALARTTSPPALATFTGVEQRYRVLKFSARMPSPR